MSTISVFDMAGKQVSETELNDAVFGITPNEAVMRQKALETEGYRSCKTGLDTCSSVVPRRRGSRSQAQRLQICS